MLRSDDHDRVRVLTLDRPEALNAFDEALYDAAAEALIATAGDPAVAVVVITGAGRAFCAGTDLHEMAARVSGDLVEGTHGFPGFVDRLADFDKPLLCAVNGLALGIGVTMLGYADLVLMSTEARIRCPFTSLGVAPEAGSSATFPALLGRQAASWALMSSEWISAQECLDMGLVWRLCPSDELLPTTLEAAHVLASKPISSLVETKRAIVAPLREAAAAARSREDEAYRRLLGGPANREALAAFAEKRQPDFAAADVEWAASRRGSE